MALDALYPWLPVALDWRAGELARYLAMTTPHQAGHALPSPLTLLLGFLLLVVGLITGGPPVQIEIQPR